MVKHRAWIAVGVALAAGGVVITDALYNPTGATDLDQLWHAARALRHGLDPYQVIGPGGAVFHWDWAFYYPLTAAVLLLPLSFLPLLAARVVFAMLSSGALAYGLSAGPRWRLFVLASASFLWAAGSGQWSVLFTASLLIPWLAVIYPVKPNLAVAYVAGQDRLRTAWLVGWAALVLVSVVIGGWWVPDWLAALGTAPHFRPYVFHIGGPLLLLAVLRWRQREARLLLAMSVVPMTTMIYETLPLLLIPATRRECLLLVVLANVASAVQLTLVHAPTEAEYIWRYGDITLWLVYVPALVMILRRANEGAVPVWAERLTSRLPGWLRGRAPIETA